MIMAEAITLIQKSLGVALITLSLKNLNWLAIPMLMLALCYFDKNKNIENEKKKKRCRDDIPKSSLIPRPHPAFHRLPYCKRQKAGQGLRMRLAKKYKKDRDDIKVKVKIRLCIFIFTFILVCFYTV